MTKDELIDYIFIKSSNTYDIFERTIVLGFILENFFNKHDLGYLGIERPFMGKSKKVYGLQERLLQQIDFVMRTMYGKSRIRWYAPRQIKSFFGKGIEQKNELFEVIKTSPIVKENNLQSMTIKKREGIIDAIAIGYKTMGDVLKIKTFQELIVLSNTEEGKA